MKNEGNDQNLSEDQEEFGILDHQSLKTEEEPLEREREKG